MCPYPDKTPQLGQCPLLVASVPVSLGRELYCATLGQTQCVIDSGARVERTESWSQRCFLLYLSLRKRSLRKEENELSL